MENNKNTTTLRKRSNEDDDKFIKIQRMKIDDENQNQVNFNINDFPRPILNLILSFAGYSSMYNILCVCKRWSEASKSQPFMVSMLRDYCRPRLTKYAIKEENYKLISKFDLGRTWRDVFSTKREIDKLDNTTIDINNNNTQIQSINNNYSIKIDKGTKSLNTFGFYEGELVDGKMEGKGYMYKKGEGIIYAGEFKNDKVDGFGVRYWSNGDKYKGFYKDAKKDGKGKFTSPVSGTYIGEYVKDRKDGKGIMYYVNGGRYEGEWKNDMAHGNGKFTSRDNVVYDGEWEFNGRNGYGVLENRDGIFSGNWKNNQLNGKGTIKYKNGDIYEGEILDGTRHGIGKLVTHDGEVYEGEFKIGQKCGKGVYKVKSGKVYTGFFKDDKPEGVGEVACGVSKFKFVGRFKSGLKHGEAKIYHCENHFMTAKYLKGNVDSYEIVDPKILQSLNDLKDLSFNDNEFFREPEKCD